MSDTHPRQRYVKERVLDYPAISPRYIRSAQLLSLQVPTSARTLVYETCFQVVHQSQELFFKIDVMFLEEAVFLIEEGEIERAIPFLDRAAAVMRHLGSQIDLLGVLLSRDEFARFRANLTPASGADSVQFREIEYLIGIKEASFSPRQGFPQRSLPRLRARFTGRDLRSAVFYYLRTQGFSLPADAGRREGPEERDDRVVEVLREMRQDPTKNPLVHRLVEACLGLDEALIDWRRHHVRLAARMIGGERGTGGTAGAPYLEQMISKRGFPELL